MNEYLYKTELAETLLVFIEAATSPSKNRRTYSIDLDNYKLDIGCTHPTKAPY